MELAYKKTSKMRRVSRIILGSLSAVCYLAVITPRYKAIINDYPGFASLFILAVGPVAISIFFVLLSEGWFSLNFSRILNKTSHGGFDCFTNALHIAVFMEELKNGHITITKIRPEKVRYKIRYHDGQIRTRNLRIINRTSWDNEETKVVFYNNEIAFFL